MEIPEPINSTVEKIYKYYENLPDFKRKHLGASIAGHFCDRYLWLSFRWVIPQFFPGRIKLLFGVGFREEDVARENLQKIGCEIAQVQDYIKLSGHVGGSCDGVILSGLPEAPKTPHILEVKTHNDSSWKDVEKQGVKASKPQHYTQCQLYMGGKKLTRTLYYAINKNTSAIYVERIKFDPDFFQSALTRAETITLTPDLPPPIRAGSSTWWQCKMCSFFDYCWQGAENIEKTCRSCSHAEPKKDGSWYCRRWNGTIPAKEQEKGCQSWKKIGSI